LDFEVEGMHCGACAARIERALSRLPGARDASVNFATKKARVAGDVSSKAAIEAVAAVGYQMRPASELKPVQAVTAAQREARLDLILAVAFTLPVVALGMGHADFPGSGLLQLVFTTLVLAFPGRGFFERALGLLRHRSVNMDTLVSLGAAAAYLMSVAILLRGGQDLYFEAASVIVTLVLVGRFLEERARNGTQEAIRKLAGLQVRTARKINADGSETDVPAETLRPGDLILVRPGERVPIDGEVIQGSSTLDESMMTGESLPVPRGPGEPVIGATTNTGKGRLVVRCTRSADETVLSRIVSLVEEAQASKARVQRLADRVSLYFVPAVLLVAAATFCVWFFALGVGVEAALYPAVAVLVIACPCALGLATPTAILVGTGRAAQDLILIRSAPGLESAGGLTAVVLDKTGTLTVGRPMVTSFTVQPGFDRRWVLACLTAAESASQHPLATAVVGYGEMEEAPRAKLARFTEHAGRGVEAVVENEAGGQVDCLVGRRRFLEAHGVALPEAWLALEATAGQGLFFVALDGQAAAAVQVDDPLRSSSRAAVAELERLGVRVIMATGDREAVARDVADRVGIRDVRFGLLPEDKVALVMELRSEGAKVGMVGDGINDAPALAAADVGIAVGGGTDIAVDAAAIVIPHGNLAKVAESILISKRTMHIIRQNLLWAFMYNVLAVPIAAAGRLSPMIAAAAMAFSSVSVVGNSLRLKQVKR